MLKLLCDDPVDVEACACGYVPLDLGGLEASCTIDSPDELDVISVSGCRGVGDRNRLFDVDVEEERCLEAGAGGLSSISMTSLGCLYVVLLLC